MGKKFIETVKLCYLPSLLYLINIRWQYRRSSCKKFLAIYVVQISDVQKRTGAPDQTHRRKKKLRIERSSGAGAGSF